MDTRLALLAIYRKTRLTLRECADQLNVTYNTARNMRAQGTWPIPMAGSPLTADIEDVAKHLDSLKETA